MTPLLGGAEAAREDGLPLRPHEGQHPTYSNARRAGRTQPDLRENIGITDPRHVSKRGLFLNGEPILANRADRRAKGERSSYGPGPFRRRRKAGPKPEWAKS